MCLCYRNLPTPQTYLESVFRQIAHSLCWRAYRHSCCTATFALTVSTFTFCTASSSSFRVLTYKFNLNSVVPSNIGISGIFFALIGVFYPFPWFYIYHYVRAFFSQRRCPLGYFCALLRIRFQAVGLSRACICVCCAPRSRSKHRVFVVVADAFLV